jgi:hypothetical protein
VRGPRFAAMDYSPWNDYAALALTAVLVIVLCI